MTESIECRHNPDKLQELVDVTKSNGEKLDAIKDVFEDQNRTIVRWLLVVVCAIALGNKALELAQQLGKTAVIAHAESR